MDETIAALRAEIEAVEKKRGEYLHRFLNGEHNNLIVRDNCVSLYGRIQGLQTAVNLLERQRPQELP